MSIWSRLLGRRDGGDYEAGLALYESGRYGEAAECFRNVDPGGSGNGSLSDFYLRQCLMRDGRRLLSERDPDAAVAAYAEAAERWPTFPDLRFWLGVSLARSERWSEALAQTQEALRFNPDYVEARLLEACALRELDQPEQAAESLNALLESGVRIEHPVIRYLDGAGPFTAANVPENLLTLLHDSAGSNRDESQVNDVVETFRSGDWDAGIHSLRQLVAANPTFPDYRVKLAAALFQTGSNTEALDEVAQALTLNPRYRTAAHLKALILADQHRFGDAREIIEIQEELTDPGTGHPGEELFCSYLGAVLALLTGRRDEARRRLAPWGDLTSSFPMAELLLAAADDLDGAREAAHRRLEVLAARWSVDQAYHFYLTAHLATRGLWDAAEKALDRWPALEEPAGDDRRDYMRAQVALAAGKEPRIPTEHAEEPAWRFLEARAHAAREDWLPALISLRGLIEDGATTEALASLLLKTYLALDEDEAVELPEAPAAVVLQDRICLMHRQERTGRALAQLQRLQELHPEDLRWTWLDPSFWLTPVRRWIG